MLIKIRGFCKIFLYSIPMGIVISAMTYLLLCVYMFILELTGPSISEKEVYYSLIAYSCIIAAIIVSLINSFIYFVQSRKKAGDSNRFRRKHIRRFHIKDVDKNHLVDELERLGYIDIEKKQDKITAKHPGKRMPQTNPVIVGEWYRSRKLELFIKESEVVVTMEPIQRRELMDFSLSNYFFLDSFVEELGWKEHEVTNQISNN